MLLHAVHNLGASLAATNCLTICFSFLFDWGGIIMLGVLVALVWRQEKSWMVEHLAGEVTDDVYQLATSWPHWLRARWQALLQADVAPTGPPAPDRHRVGFPETPTGPPRPGSQDATRPN